MNSDSTKVDNDLLYHIALLHTAYHNIELQLHQLKQILALGTHVSARLQAYFTLEADMVSTHTK